MKNLHFILLALIFCYTCKNTSNSFSKKIVNSQKKVELIQYKNKKIGLKYSLPKNYKLTSKPIEIIDLSGKIKKTEIEYLDSLIDSSIIFNFYPEENGETIYSLKKNLFQNPNNKVKVGNIDGVITKERIAIDGRGKELKTPKELIKIDFYKEDNGYVQIIVKSKETDTISITKILSSVEFLNIK